MKVRWTRPALRDLDQIQDFVARENPRAAYELVSTIHRRATELLSSNPLAGRGGRIPGTREFPVAGSPYVVAYSVADEAVDILAVVHGRRRWPNDFG